jgi:uncharacterized protein
MNDERMANTPFIVHRSSFSVSVNDSLPEYRERGQESSPLGASRSGEHWKTIRSGLRQKVTPRGPWLQYFDAVGFEWNTFELAIHELPAALHGFRILQLADVHVRTYWPSAYDDLIDHVRADVPDLILFTGDMVQDKLNPAPALPIARRLVSALSARCGLYAIRGNHDLSIWQTSFVGTPLRFIDGQRLLLNSNGANVELIGVPGPERKNLTDEFIATIPAKTPRVPRIMMSHFPDHIRRLESLGPDVYMAGHTHGGQVCLPFGWPIMRHDSLPVEMSKGVHRLAHSWFIVSRGFGFSDTPVRLFCPAEVVEMRLIAG